MGAALDHRPLGGPNLDLILSSLADDPEITSWRVDVDRDGDALVTRIMLRFHDSAEDEPSLFVRVIEGEADFSCSLGYADDIDMPRGALFHAMSTDPNGPTNASHLGHNGHRAGFRVMSLLERALLDDHG